MKHLAALLVMIGLLAGCAATESGTKAKDKSAGGTSAPAFDEDNMPSDPPTETEAPPPPPEADPEVKFSHSCEYILGDFTEYSSTGYRFVADANLKNTGNVGVVSRVHATWFQAGGGKVEMTKFGVRIPYNGNKRVGFLKQVGENEIDLIQAMNYDDQCKVDVVMVDTYGEAHD